MGPLCNVARIFASWWLTPSARWIQLGVGCWLGFGLGFGFARKSSGETVDSYSCQESTLLVCFDPSIGVDPQRRVVAWGIQHCLELSFLPRCRELLNVGFMAVAHARGLACPDEFEVGLLQLPEMANESLVA